MILKLPWKFLKRWDSNEAIDQKNEQVKHSKTTGQEYVAETFANGNSRKQLLARSRYLLYKSPDKWTMSQKERASILFKEYPEIKKAYKLVNNLRKIFNQVNDIKVAYTKLAHWYNEVEKSGFKSFQTVANSISINYRSILNYFILLTGVPMLLLNPLMQKLKLLEHNSEE